MKEKFWTHLSAKLLFPPTSSHCFTIFQKLGWAQLRLVKEKPCQKSSILLLFPQLHHYLTFPFLYPLINPSHFSFLLSIGVERKHYKVITTLFIWGIQPRVPWPSKIITAICLSIVLEEKQAHPFTKKEKETQKPWKTETNHQNQQSQRILR